MTLVALLRRLGSGFALTVWQAKKGQALHSFHHTMADRLRNAGVPQEVMNAIGGWKTEGMAARHGAGFSLETKRDALRKVIS